MRPSPSPPSPGRTAVIGDPIDLDIYNEEVKEYMKHIIAYRHSINSYMQLSGDRQWKWYMPG